ncbi:MAG: hypothetical protein PHD95_01525 [Candidatus ainarchaeum sp.]|nr:hypothetical protein [Candidatus ainarchaeum sp.]
METEKLMKTASHAVLLVVLVLVLLGILTWTGVLRPSQVPVVGKAWCSVYWGVMGYSTGGPKVLIVYGDDGLGNPDGPCEAGLQQCSLKEILANPEILGVRADTMRLSSVNLGNLKSYSLVIVEKAKTMETKYMRAFIDYYAQGGRLVWTGDAGTELGHDDEYLYTNERSETDANQIIGPWARKQGDVAVSLDQLLSVEYTANYCTIKTCPAGQAIYVGKLSPEPTGTHPLIFGMGNNLPLYVFKDEDFSVVETIAGGITTQALTLDVQSNLVGTNGKDYGNQLPLIVASGMGDRAVYYALPPEYYANPKLYNSTKPGTPGPYFLPIENLYYGMICG